MAEKETKKALPESMYFLMDTESGNEIGGPFNKQELENEIEERDSEYWDDELRAFVVSYDGEKLVYQQIGIEVESKVDLVISPHKDTL